jgi:hypothetical protein
MKRVVAIGDLGEQTHFVEHDTPITKPYILKTKPPSLPRQGQGTPIVADFPRTPRVGGRGAPNGASASPASSSTDGDFLPASFSPGEVMGHASSALPWVAGALGVVAVGAVLWAIHNAQELEDERRRERRR